MRIVAAGRIHRESTNDTTKCREVSNHEEHGGKDQSGAFQKRVTRQSRVTSGNARPMTGAIIDRILSRRDEDTLEIRDRGNSGTTI